MRKFMILFIALTCLMIPALADEELDLDEMLSGADPGVVADTYIAPPQDSEDFEMLEDEGEPSIYEKDGSVLITITAGGDFTIGRDVRKRADIFGDELEKQGGDVNFIFKNISDVLRDDDLTILNFEGTLTESSYIPSEKRENQFLFSAPPDWAGVLPTHSVEAVALENNHVMDHGADALDETKAALTGAGVVYSTGTELGVIEIKGVQIAMLSYLTIDRYDELWDVVPRDIENAKRFYPIVIVSFHWGNETWYYPTDNQVKMGRLAVDSGADLVLGHHSHRINPIEQYKGKYICYSLGNFCFAGNSKPSDMSSFLFQTRFRLKNGEITNEGFRIIPIRISSRTDRNDFVPTVLTKDSAIDAVISTLKENGKRLEYAVEEYPLEWTY